jgi:hypothetical protein
MSFWRNYEQGEVDESIEANTFAMQPTEQQYEDPYQDETSADAAAAEAVAEEMRTLSEVEKRLRKANYYRAILENGIFDGEVTLEGEEVADEFREFAISRLRELMGLMAPKPPAEEQPFPFSKEEILALKLWANQLAGKAHLLQPSAPKPTRKAPVSQVALAAQPQPAPVPTQVAPPPAPPKAPQQPQVRRMADPSAPRRPAPQRRQAPAQEASKAPQQRKSQVQEVVAPDGSTVKVNLKGPARPVGIQPVPMPSPEMALAFEAARSEQMAEGSIRRALTGK